MKIALINTHDSFGGAARAAYRTHRGLLSIGLDSTMIVRHKGNDDESVETVNSSFGNSYLDKFYYGLDLIPYARFMKRPYLPWSVGWIGSHSLKRISGKKYDILNLHWINRGFICIKDLGRINKPIVWTLHDMWAFTGGCHYSSGCDRYTESCGNCPKLTSRSENDLTRRVWKRKKDSWQGIDLSIVTPSRWLADCAKRSSLFCNLTVKVIPYGLDNNSFKPLDKQVCREALGLPKHKTIILMGAMSSTSDKRKGFQFLKPALRLLGSREDTRDIQLVIFGSKEPKQPVDMGLETTYLGNIKGNEKLCQIYSSADVFVAPSIEENLSNMVMEAMACGAPCVAFDIGGMPDMIEHKGAGYLVDPYDVQDLAHGIRWVTENSERNKRLSQRARIKMEKDFNAQRMAASYRELFLKLL